ncbi:tetratricopeptide repeat protein [Kamptonema animale CS-326]|jgi:tetratricopeptide (TPR) repeat protein|uniref:tetratricopeptide repeat protein n=1 Tax=Kamptonema animale TaxID=92934 RepID=UPI00232AFB76|nr:tetratricopeptide repeat protein [Kamptonema animale]MDB9513360.1 tetratricopeptide repeat protein [Kamptonema animale CS-326]
MIDSLKASEQGLKIVDEARLRKRWQKTASIWVKNAKTSEATLKRFWARCAIERSTFMAICEAVGVNWEEVAELSEIQETDLPLVSPVKENPSALNLNFIGRENAIAHLNTRINQGAKVILIQAPGGVGKTTLAQEYLKSQGFDLILELLMAKEKENITLVESVIEEWLKRDFQEEPGREFGVTLGRLKRQLQTRRVGILIDNLEPALDGQGRFIEPHRRYVELLRVLADSSVQSVTLITSREPLAECVGVTNYSLPSLDEKAWQDFFSRDIEIDEITLKEMHKAYGGNALAMNILCDPIQRDGGMVDYWQEHKVEAGLLVELAVENLVKEQFNRLEKTSPEAYRLLCRLGCYRYQDVPTVPTEGLLCLLWDVPESQRRRVIDSLRSRSLVECFKGEYWLHPVIRAEAISRLRESEDWKITNQTAAEFWTESVKTVETIADAKKALEAYYHYFEIKEFDLAGRVFVIRRSNKWTKNYIGEYFSGSLYRFGLLQQTISEFNQIIDKIFLDINTADLLIELYLSIGDIHYAKGEPNRGIDYHKKTQQIVSNFLENTYKKEEDLESFLKKTYVVSFVNIGYGYISIGEIETAKKFFEGCYFATQNTEFHYHSVDACYFLAFCNSCLSLNQEAHNLAEKAYRELSITEWQPWSHGWALIFLGLTYKNLREIPKAFEMFQRAIKFAEDSYYIQIKGQACSGLAELYRIQGEFETALLNHSESIQLLEKIGAKCDLAEAYYQLGLTYQTIGNTADSQENFNKAIQLFTEMEAPRQVEKVQQAAGKLI